jgi:hypothetical protein
MESMVWRERRIGGLLTHLGASSGVRTWNQAIRGARTRDQEAFAGVVSVFQSEVAT